MTAGKTYWFANGMHTLEDNEFDQHNCLTENGQYGFSVYEHDGAGHNAPALNVTLDHTRSRPTTPTTGRPEKNSADAAAPASSGTRPEPS